MVKSNHTEQLYSVQSLPSRATVSANFHFNKNLHHNNAQIRRLPLRVALGFQAKVHCV